MRVLAAGGLLLAATAFAGDVDVRTTAAGRVSLRVGSAPLSEVLDRLSHHTGMKVVYDGAPPRTVVRGRDMEDASPEEAVVNVLEGLGVGYALRLDPTGARVETLLVVGTSGGSAPRLSTVAPPPPLRPPGVQPPPPPPPMMAEEPDDDDAPAQGARIEELFTSRPGQEEKEEAPRPVGPPAANLPFPGFPNILPAPQPSPTPAPSGIAPLFLSPTPVPSPPPQ